MDLLGQSSLIVAVTSFALGASVLARNVRNKLFLSFAAVTGLISFWALFFFLSQVWEAYAQGFYWLHLLMNVWLAPAGLGFLLLMMRIQDRVSRVLLDLSVILALVLSTILVFGYDPEGFGRVILQMVYFAPAVLLVEIVHLMRKDSRLRRGVRMLPKIPTVGLVRRNWIYMGAILVLLTCTMDHLAFTNTGPARIIPALGNLGLAVYLFFVSQAISQQRLLNFSALLSRFLVLFAVGLILAVVYSVLLVWIQDRPGLFFLNSFIVSFLILMLLEPLRSAVRYLTGRMLTQEHRKLERTLREAQRNLTLIVEPSVLFQAILLTVEQILRPERAALFVLRTDGTKYRRVRAVGQDVGELQAITPVRELMANHRLIEYCLSLHRRGLLPVVLDQILENEIDRSASRSQRESLSGLLQGLKALGCNLLIPLIDSGEVIAFVTCYVPVPPEPWGNNWGLLGILQPYFDQAAQALRSMEVYARQREKERLATIGEMAAGLAHEIRNPLGAIKGAAQYLEPSDDRPEGRFLNVIIEEVDRLNRVVTQFLDYSKPPELELKRLDVASLVEKTVERLRPSLDPRVKLVLRIPSGPVEAEIAAEPLQQVLINLLQNAYHALGETGEMGKNGRQPSCVVSIEEEGADLVISIEDNGPGIRKESMEKLFIPFFTTSPSGTGLGLPISQKIIEAHRGRIEVSSEEGKFSRFSVTLPRQADAGHVRITSTTGANSARGGFGEPG